MNPDSTSMPRPARLSFVSLLCSLLFLSAAVGSAQVSVKGSVVNRTTGQPAPGVALTLITFVGGMSPVEEVYSSADGTFAFEKELSTSSGQPMLGMVRAEHEGVPYTTMLRAGMAGDVTVEVFSVDETTRPTPNNHIVIFEPGASELVINETFMFINEATPPRAFRNAEEGTLRFHLPPGAGGEVSVQATGPAGMPLKSTAEPAGPENIYKVDFPLKPGENRLDVVYRIPHGEGDGFAGKLLYDGLKTMVAAPQGVTLEGDDLKPLGTEAEHTQASLFEIPASREYQIAAIRGIGQLRRPNAGGASGGQGGSGAAPISVEPAPIAAELTWLLILTGGILAVGFIYLYSAKTGDESSAPNTTTASQRKPVRSRRKS